MVVMKAGSVRIDEIKGYWMILTKDDELKKKKKTIA